MTPQEINIAIAEILGEEVHPDHAEHGEDDGFFYVCERCNATRLWNSPKTAGPCVRGNYFDDLNACHEMEKHIDRVAGLYCDHLATVVGIRQHSLAEACHNFDPNDSLTHPTHYCRLLAMATAPQRCEAFLRVHGKWIK